VIHQARGVGHMEVPPSETIIRVAERRRCVRCGAYLSASNEQATCFPCQRHENEVAWLKGGSRRRGAYPG
jgi:hypothetical protein